MSGVRESGVDEALDGILAAAVDLLDASYGAVIDGGPPAVPWRAVHEHFAIDDLARLEAGIRSARIPERLAEVGLPVLIEDLQWTGTVGTGAPVRVLAVPIGRARARAGGLVVAAAGRPRFDEGDSRLLQAVAAAAAIALRSVALHAEVLHREAWSDASAGIVSALLTGGLDAPLAVMAARVTVLAHADAVCILRGDRADDALTVAAVCGPGLPGVGERVSVRGSVPGAAMESLQPRAVAVGMLPRSGGLAPVAPSGPMMVAPMVSVDAALGVIVVLRHRGAPAFSPFELDLLAGFVGHTTVALQLAEVRADRERILLIEDRARIARDLHDIVIQQLFAAGLELRATAAAVPLPRVQTGIDAGVASIDGAIDRIRAAVLAVSADPARASLRHRILDVVHDLRREFAQTPQLRFDGPVELVARGDLADDVVAVVREALTNVARHAGAAHAGVIVAVLDGCMRVEVWDDGRGMPPSVRRSGLANLEERASQRRGEFVVGGRNPTRAIWSVPYGSSQG